MNKSTRLDPDLATCSLYYLKSMNDVFFQREGRVCTTILALVCCERIAKGLPYPLDVLPPALDADIAAGASDLLT